MDSTSLTILILLFFVTSAVGVVTGSNSLITVPVMFQFGIEPKVAVATNMFGLTFMNIGATLAFLRADRIPFRGLTPLVAVTLVGSALGALLVGSMTSDWVPVFVTVSMLFVVAFMLFGNGTKSGGSGTGRTSSVIAIALTFLLGIYGGMYSGGYVTMLTAVLAAFYGMSFTEAVVGTKFINVFSSAVATIVFAWQGLIDYRLGLILAATMFIAAFAGAKLVTKLDETVLKRIFIAAVVLLAAKTAWDVFSG